MKEYIEQRVLTIADYIIASNSTVRETAKKFGISKSTVHKDVTERITELNPQKAQLAKCVLDKNMAERHIRGGEATRIKHTHCHIVVSRNRHKTNSCY